MVTSGYSALSGKPRSSGFHKATHAHLLKRGQPATGHSAVARAIPRALAAYPGNLRDADGRETLVQFDETRDCRGGGSPCYAAEPAVFTVLRGSG